MGPSRAEIEGALLCSVLADPDDDVPRLVYADWLTDRGDARGDFIRDQCRLARLDEADPAFSALHARTERALRRHQRAWIEPLWAGFPADRSRYPAQFAFVRGFAEEVHASMVCVPDLQRLATIAPIHTVRIAHDGGGPDLGPLLRAVQRAGARALDFAGGTPAALARPFPADLDIGPIEGLGLAMGGLPPAAVANLARMLAGARLKSLALPFAGLRDGDIARLVGSGALDGVERLVLDNNNLGALGLRRIEAAAGETAASLYLAGTPLSAGYGRWMGGWRPLRALAISPPDRDLDTQISADVLAPVRHLEIGGRPAGDLRAVPFHSLTRLRLGLGRMQRDTIAALASDLLPGLVELSCGGGLVGDGDLEVLLEAADPGRLCALDLSRCRLTDRGVAALAAWPGLRHCTRLDLSNNEHIGTEGLRALAASPHFDPVALFLRQVPRAERLREPLAERFGDALSLSYTGGWMEQRLRADGVRWWTQRAVP